MAANAITRTVWLTTEANGKFMVNTAGKTDGLGAPSSGGCAEEDGVDKDGIWVGRVNGVGECCDSFVSY
jgi:hypothetical protein